VDRVRGYTGPLQVSICISHVWHVYVTHTWHTYMTRVHLQQETSFCRNLTMGWLRLVGSLTLPVNFAEYSLFYRALLPKRPHIHDTCSFATRTGFFEDQRDRVSLEQVRQDSHTYTHIHLSHIHAYLHTLLTVIHHPPLSVWREVLRSVYKILIHIHIYICHTYMSHIHVYLHTSLIVNCEKNRFLRRSVWWSLS